SRALDPHLDRHDLEGLCIHHRVPRSARHRALPDAEVTAVLLVQYLRRLEEIGVRTREQLLDVAGCGPVPRDEPREVSVTDRERGLLAEAAELGDRVLVVYRTATGGVKEARIVPYAVDRVGGRERLIAFDLDRDVTRSLLLDRLLRVGDPPTVPAGPVDPAPGASLE
ncbi:MAG: hypothetical protein HKN12_00120, partial [Gemmatimonadetes bacterium]|nr:hypothetical protein [Gemmatimonadota bacterium]